jgi:hypothetical protein
MDLMAQVLIMAEGDEPVTPGFDDSAMLIGPVAVNGDGVVRQAYVDGVMVNL